MTVGRVMCTRLVTVRADDTVLEAINLMVEEQWLRARLRRPEACAGSSPSAMFCDSPRSGSARGAQGGRRDDRPAGDDRPVRRDHRRRTADGRAGRRHLPVVEGEFVHGVVGIRDVLRTLVERAYREHDEDARETAKELLKRR